MRTADAHDFCRAWKQIVLLMPWWSCAALTPPYLLPFFRSEHETTKTDTVYKMNQPLLDRHYRMIHIDFRREGFMPTIRTYQQRRTMIEAWIECNHRERLWISFWWA